MKMFEKLCLRCSVAGERENTTTSAPRRIVLVLKPFPSAGITQAIMLRFIFHVESKQSRFLQIKKDLIVNREN